MGTGLRLQPYLRNLNGRELVPEKSLAKAGVEYPTMRMSSRRLPIEDMECLRAQPSLRVTGRLRQSYFCLIMECIV